MVTIDFELWASEPGASLVGGSCVFCVFSVRVFETAVLRCAILTGVSLGVVTGMTICAVLFEAAFLVVIVIRCELLLCTFCCALSFGAVVCGLWLFAVFCGVSLVEFFCGVSFCAVFCQLPLLEFFCEGSLGAFGVVAVFRRGEPSGFQLFDVPSQCWAESTGPEAVRLVLCEREG